MPHYQPYPLTPYPAPYYPPNTSFVHPTTYATTHPTITHTHTNLSTTTNNHRAPKNPTPSIKPQPTQNNIIEPHIRIPTFELPMIYGDNAYQWIQDCEGIFDLAGIPGNCTHKGTSQDLAQQLQCPTMSAQLAKLM
jgi:hypothetical protein